MRVTLINYGIIECYNRPQERNPHTGVTKNITLLSKISKDIITAGFV